MRLPFRGNGKDGSIAGRGGTNAVPPRSNTPIPGGQVRLLCAFFGALICLATALITEGLFDHFSVQERLDEGGGRALLFTNDLRRRLRRENANDGDVQISLAWNDYNDLDLSVVEPSGEKIYYQHKISATRGNLDVDMNAQTSALMAANETPRDDPDRHISSEPVEHIYWPRGAAPTGTYRVYVKYFARHSGPPTSNFTLEIFNKGQTRTISNFVAEGEGPRGGLETLVDTFEVKPGGFRMPLLPRVSGGFLTAMGVLALWGAMLAAGFALLLRPFVNHLLGKRPPTTRVEFARTALLSLGAGALAGMASQSLFWLTAVPGEREGAGLWLGCVLLGAALGFGLSRVVPRLPGLAASVWGALAGLLCAGLFAYASARGLDSQGRVADATLLGAVFGFLITLPRPTPPEPTEIELGTLTYPSLRPRRLHAYVRRSRVEEEAESRR